MYVRFLCRTVLLACALCIGYTPPASPQVSPRLEQEDTSLHVTEPMRALNFLIGDWQGKVRYESGSEALWTARVRYGLGGNFLVIDERGNEVENRDRITRGILVVVYWDPAANEYPARLYWSSRNGAGSVEAKAYVQDNTLTLQDNGPRRINRYTIRLDKAGKWQEVGELSADGGESWKRTFSMTLNRHD